MSDEPQFDVAILGGGPAGVAAALSLRKLGVARVVIIERESEIGGVPRHCGHPPFGMHEFGRVLTGPAYASRLRGLVEGAGIVTLLGTTVVALERGGRLRLTSAGGEGAVRASRVLLATGARETPRSARMLSGDRPIGVITTGTLQQSIYIERLKPFQRPVIVGTELVSLSAVLTCWKAGIRPVAVVELANRPTANRALAVFPRLLGVPVHYGTKLVDIVGNPRVESVTIELADGSLRHLVCDGLLLTGQFVPESSLVRASHLEFDPASGGPAIDQFGRCSDPSYFAAGNLLRPVETASWSYREGAWIAEFMAADLAGRLPGAEVMMAIVPGSGIKYVVPQRIAVGALAPGLTHLQLRAALGGTGWLVLRQDGKVHWRSRASMLPERRMLAPMDAIPKNGVGPISIDFEPKVHSS